MKRNGKKLAVLPDGAPRRMADAKNAWRKMTWIQRAEFLGWIGVCQGNVGISTEQVREGVARFWKEPTQ